MKNITKEIVLKFVSENNPGLSCTHTKLSVPIINRIYRKMLVGIKFTEIKIADGLICNGHHRYLASLMAKCDIGTIPFLTTAATEVTDWKSVIFEENDWDSAEEIEMFNQQDAEYNDISIEKLNELMRNFVQQC